MASDRKKVSDKGRIRLEVLFLFFSDVVVQIVDARNPLLFRCEDLESYVRELSPDNKKLNVILVNKSDLLTDEQR